MKIVKISDLSEKEKEQWQQQVQARQQERIDFINRDREEANRLFNERSNGEAFNNTQTAQPLPTQNFQKLLQTKNQEQEKAKKAPKVSSNNNNVKIPQVVQGPTTKQNLPKGNVILPPIQAQNLSNIDLSQATELTNNKYKAMQEAKKINEDMKRRRL